MGRRFLSGLAGGGGWLEVGRRDDYRETSVGAEVSVSLWYGSARRCGPARAGALVMTMRRGPPSPLGDFVKIFTSIAAAYLCPLDTFMAPMSWSGLTPQGCRSLHRQVKCVK